MRGFWSMTIDRITEPQVWIDGLLKIYAPNSEDIDVALQNMGLRIKELESREQNFINIKSLAVEAYKRFIDYDMSVDCDVPYEHRDFMRRLEKHLKTL